MTVIKPDIDGIPHTCSGGTVISILPVKWGGRTSTNPFRV